MRLRLSSIVRFVFAAGLTSLLLWRSHPSDVGAALAHVTWGPIGLACLLVVLDRVLMAYRWMALLAAVAPSRPSSRALWRIFLVSTFIGTFLPASIGSDAVRVWSLSRAGVATATSLASVLMDRLLGVIAIVIAAVTGLALAPTVIPGMVDDRRVTWSFAIVAVACAGALAVVFSVRLDDLLRRMMRTWREGRLRSSASRVLDSLQAYRREHRMLGMVLAASVAVQALRILQAWLLGLSLAIHASLAGYFVLIPIILLVMLLPVTINGLGTSQAAFVWGFGLLGVARADAFALSLLFLALGVLGNLPGGIIYLFNPARPALAAER